MERKHPRVTLVKMPRVLSECLERYDIVDAGYIEERNGVEMFCVGPEIGPSNFPREWRVQTGAPKTEMFTFVKRAQNAFIDGVVMQEMIITPEITPKYLQYKKERARMIEMKREVKPVNSLREGIRMERYGATEYDIMARKRKKMLMEKKRERLGKTEVIEMIFRAFEEFPYWSLKNLADRLEQPQAYIQELLPSIAVMNKKMHRNMYELKPEYKRDS